MGIWGKISQRADGNIVRKEMESAIYGDSGMLDTGEYDGFNYEIWTTGNYPYIKMTTSRLLPMYYGSDLIELQDEKGKTLTFDRIPDHMNNRVSFVYSFNTADDFVKNEHPGKKYTIDDLKQFAEIGIDLLVKNEKDLFDKKSTSD